MQRGNFSDRGTMKIIRSIKQMQKISLDLKREGKTIAVVPTMGCLHEGHLSLMSLATKKADVVIATLFVNPSQFGPSEDFARYPRREKADLLLLKKLGVDFVLIPKVSDMYPENFQSWIEVTEVTKPLCGKSRPGHFRGVATVVMKLFQITQADVAIFGKKDFQQLVTIKRMVEDLNLPIKIIGTEIIREKDGLALSSRNIYLSDHERKLALSLSQSLLALREAFKHKSLSVAAAKKLVKSQISHDKSVRIDYLECLDAENLVAINQVVKGRTLVALAVFVGKTRLIDNIII